MKELKLPITLALSLGLVLSTATPASAWSLSIFGNGANSFNKIKANSGKSFNVVQSNSFSSSTNIGINANTGGNKVSKSVGGLNAISTGNIKTKVNVSNIGGFNFFHHEGCCDHGECDPTPTPTMTPTPEPECEEVTVWGEGVGEVDQGTLKSGDPIVDPERTDADNALGDPDGEFFSIGEGGSIVITFDEPVIDVEGNDLSFHEVTNGRDSYPEEKAEVEAWDGDSWVYLGEVSNKAGGDGVDYLDLSTAGLTETMKVRISDSTDYSLHDDEADGYDLDAVDATRLSCEEVNL